MKPIAQTALSELVLFLSSYNLTSVATDPNIKSLLRTSFRPYFSVLLLEHALQARPLWTDDQKAKRVHLYLREALSDLCQAQLLAVQGLYKPSYLSLRSSIENFVRVIGLAEDQAVLSLTSVFVLFDVVRETPFITQDAFARRSFNVFESEYSQLCGYVHTASAAHMALTTTVGAFPRSIPGDAAAAFKALQTVADHFCRTICLLMKGNLRRLHYRHLDVVCDSLPKAFKKHVLG